MKKQFCSTILALTLLVTLLSGCADLSGKDANSQNGENAAGDRTRSSETLGTTQADPKPTQPAAPILLSQTDAEGDVFYDRYLKDQGQPKSAVVVTADGVKHFYAFSQKKGEWTKLPDRSYRGDLFWSSCIEDGKYRDFTGSATQSDYASYFDAPRYEKESESCYLPTAFLTVDTIEVRTVCRVSFWFETTNENGTSITDDPTGRYEDKGAWLEAQETNLKALGFEVLTDHRYARQRDGVSIEDAELLIAGTVKQFEELAEKPQNGVCYHLIAASYEHYAPEQFVEVDPSLIVPRG